MERFIVREPRVGADYPQRNQLVSFPPNSGNNDIMIPETMYYGGYGAEFPARQGFMAVTHVNAPFAPNLTNQGQVVSGIDPNYLAGYSDNVAAVYVSGQRQHQQRDENSAPPIRSPFVNNYENRDFIGADRNRPITFAPQMATNSNNVPIPSLPREQLPKSQIAVQQTQPSNVPMTNPPIPSKAPAKDGNTSRTEVQLPVKTRADKLKELQRNGTRSFSGPIEKVLKWHKVLQDLGVMVLYEIVAKCVSVRAGEGCSKNLVVRDDSGPAMQVVYYEIDFLLPELKPPCTIRVVGRMMPGTCRLQAFSVRPATGDDVSTLPRRAAVAAHHVAKICKEFGISQ